jgi:N-methylhydantoinase A
LRVAIDIGGTFTDLVAYSPSSERLVYSKSLTTEHDLSQGVFDCLKLAKIDLADVECFMHGSTIAINTVIQRKGAVTGLITTRGFRHVYAIGRGNRPDAYNLLFEKAVPLVPGNLIAEVDERLDARGEVVRPLDEESVKQAIRQLVAQKVESIAVVLLHAYRNPAHEKRVRELIEKLAPGVYVTVSHDILREFREYERTSTTVLNAYVGPIVSRYVKGLGDRLRGAGFAGAFLVMQSNGGTMSDQVAVSRPVSMMESGPVAGVIGSGKLGEALGQPNVISFDMGGTTAKSSLIENGQTRVVTGYHIGGFQTGHPMMLPVIDIVEVGTGGGSIAWIDEAGGLKVGPLSAGAAPGPVCYSGGGTEPTITDANVVLGRLDPNNFCGGQMTLDAQAAREAIRTKIAEPLGLTVEEAALGILKIADTKMSLAVSEVSVQKGYDPRSFTLVAHGGGGPLHASSVARELAVPTVVVPELPGTFSAWGMLMTDIRHDYVRTVIAEVAKVGRDTIEKVYADMAEEAAETLRRDGVSLAQVKLVRSADLRYQGQEYTLTVPMPEGDDALAEVRRRFDEAHFAQYSHSAPKEAVEIVNLRLTAVGTVTGDVGAFNRSRETSSALDGKPKGVRPVYFEGGWQQCQVYDRLKLKPGVEIAGPAVIEERVSTTVLLPGDRAKMLATGPIVIEVGN